MADALNALGSLSVWQCIFLLLMLVALFQIGALFGERMRALLNQA